MTAHPISPVRDRVLVSRRGLGRLLAQTGGVLLLTTALLVLIELGAGLVVGQRQTVAPTPEIPGDAVSKTLTWLELNPAPLVRDADLLWRNEPGARKTQLVNPQAFGRKDSWTIQNNSEGFRGPERVTGDATANVLRIVCIGDSVTFGFNVDQPNTYPRQLEDVLVRRYPGRRFEVVNAGVPGWTWLQGLRFLELHGLALGPDIVVIGHGSNDQYKFLPARVTDEERLHLLGGPLVRALRALALRLADTNSFHLVEKLFPPPPFTPDQDSPGCKRQIATHGACRRVSLDEIATAVGEVHRLTTAQGMTLLVANLDFFETPAVQGIRRGAEAVGAPFVDTVAHVWARLDREHRQRAAELGLAPPSGRNETSPTPNRRKRLMFRVQVPDGHASYEVRGHQFFFSFAAPTYDDGTHGDEQSGDGVHTAIVEVPAHIPAVEYLYHREGEPEFRALPPSHSTLGYRLIHVPGDTIAPIDAFGRLAYLAERTHPNAEGHAIVAALVADSLEALPAFRRFIEAAHP
jgi:lysophospholipase L1-like esterase